jgi:hypothetical protein
LQRSENHADPMHTALLHEHQFGLDFYEIPDCTWIPTWYGMKIIADRVGHEPGLVIRRINHFIVPTLQTTAAVRREHESECTQRAAWKVPIDDTHTMTYEIFFTPFGKDGKPSDAGFGASVVGTNQDAGRRRARSYEDSQRDPGDEEAQMSQGLIVDRTNEHLGSSDRGVILWRNILKDAMSAVENGMDPIGIIREHGKNALVDVDAIDLLLNAGEERPADDSNRLR